MSRAEELASEFERAYTEFADLASGLPAEHWRRTAANSPLFHMGADERRAVGVVAHHVASEIPRAIAIIQSLAAGEPLPPTPHGGIDVFNAGHAAANAAPHQPRTVGLVRENGSRAAEVVRRLDDESLDRTGRSFVGPSTTEEFIRWVLIGHVYWHLGSLKATTAAKPSRARERGPAATSR